MNTIDISKIKKTPLSFAMVDDYRREENKGWSYSCVYSLEEIRDTYLLLTMSEFNNLKDFTQKEVIAKIPARGKDWTERRVLEVLNALVNFKLVTRNKKTLAYEVSKENPSFEIGSFGKSLSSNDIEIFKSIFFGYTRFQEFIELFADNKFDGDTSIMDHSVPVYSIRGNHKYTDTFFYGIDKITELKFISPTDKNGKKNTSCMMFWDVFISWAKNLHLVEGFNSKLFDYSLSDGRCFSCSYFLSSDSVVLPSLPSFINTHFPHDKMVDTNKIIWKVCINYRKSISEAKDYIITQYKAHKDLFAPIRTSEIFVNSSEHRDDSVVPYPRYKDSYISHLMVKKARI